jgi:hypothetical protein
MPPSFKYASVNEFRCLLCAIALTWVASRTTTFDDETKQEVNSILEKYGLSLDDFQSVTQEACVTY